MAPPDRGATAAPRPLDAVALARQTRRLQHASEPPWLHAEAARRMGERLPVVKLQPQQVVDWDAFLGASGDVLRQAYPKAQLVATEPLPRAAAPRSRSGWWPFKREAASSTSAHDLPAGQAQLVWANMALHRSLRPQQTLAAWHRALAIDGFLMFSTLGPGTLTELSALYAAAGWPPPLAPFVDMHDLGDMLVEAGFADPVMDQETLTLTWSSPEALLAELRGLGGNVDPRRHAGLRTPRWRAQLLQALQSRADAAGRIALQFELVYGHAFKPVPRAAVAAETQVPLDDLRAMVRAGRKPQ